MNTGPKPRRFPRQPRPRTLRTWLGVEALEGREVPATLAPISDFTTPDTKALYVPLTVSGANGPVNFDVTSSDPNVQAQVVTGGTTIKMTVSGTDSGGQAFQGDLVFRLFDDLAPVTTARIVQLVNQGFYNGLTFHRILDGFVAQGGDPSGDGTGGSGTKLDDEFSPLLTFNSPGLLAMANSGHDTSDSQFFVTDTKLTLAQDPQFLNFGYTIFGQLVSGFDTFQKIITTPVSDPTAGTPVTKPVIQSASVVPDDPDGVLRITAPATFTGTSAISVTPTEAGGDGTAESFNVTFQADTVNDPPFLGPVADQTVAPGTGATFTLMSTDLEHDPVTYSLVSATSSGQAVNVSPHIDQATGQVTVTPPAGFVGTIDLKFGVSDAKHAGQPDTQVVHLTVAGSFDLAAASDTGVLSDDNVTGAAAPTLTVFAPAGQTVAVTVNGTAAGTATPTATAGQYTITLPAGLLKVGANTIAGTATPAGGSATTLAAFTLTYNPSIRGVYVVPGDVGSAQQVTFQYTSHESKYQDEVGYFLADDASGKVGSLSPGDAGYAAAALARAHVLFSTAAQPGAVSTVDAKGGDVLVMYLVQNGTSAAVLANNSANSTTGGGPVAFFGAAAANPDAVIHLSAADDPAGSQAVFGWEDLTGGGDKDYNDEVVNVRLAGTTLSPTLRVPAADGRAVTAAVSLQDANKSVKSPTPGKSTQTGGEVGVIVADDATGKIGSLNPGDAGYAAAALARAQVLFAPGTETNADTTLGLAGGQSLIFYYVPGGTAAGVLAGNSGNSATGGAGKVAFFSVAAANPDGAVHARYFNPEGVSQSGPVTATDPYAVHMMGKVNGTAADFDDVVFTVQFGA